MADFLRIAKNFELGPLTRHWPSVHMTVCIQAAKSHGVLDLHIAPLFQRRLRQAETLVGGPLRPIAARRRARYERTKPGRKNLAHLTSSGS